MTHIEIAGERDKLLFSEKRFPFDLEIWVPIEIPTSLRVIVSTPDRRISSTIEVLISGRLETGRRSPIPKVSIERFTHESFVPLSWFSGIQASYPKPFKSSSTACSILFATPVISPS